MSTEKHNDSSTPETEADKKPTNESADGGIKDPRKTDHPAGEQHAAENIENEPAG
jgi:hypothetical protein